LKCLLHNGHLSKSPAHSAHAHKCAQGRNTIETFLSRQTTQVLVWRACAWSSCVFDTATALSSDETWSLQKMKQPSFFGIFKYSCEKIFQKSKYTFLEFQIFLPKNNKKSKYVFLPLLFHKLTFFSKKMTIVFKTNKNIRFLPLLFNKLTQSW
jgi:hypothetical protein